METQTNRSMHAECLHSVVLPQLVLCKLQPSSRISIILLIELFHGVHDILQTGLQTCNLTSLPQLIFFFLHQVLLTIFDLLGNASDFLFQLQQLRALHRDDKDPGDFLNNHYKFIKIKFQKHFRKTIQREVHSGKKVHGSKDEKWY